MFRNDEKAADGRGSGKRTIQAETYTVKSGGSSAIAFKVTVENGATTVVNS